MILMSHTYTYTVLYTILLKKKKIKKILVPDVKFINQTRVRLVNGEKPFPLSFYTDRLRLMIEDIICVISSQITKARDLCRHAASI